MTRGDIEFRDYVLMLADKKAAGVALTAEEQATLDQGVICGIVRC